MLLDLESPWNSRLKLLAGSFLLLGWCEMTDANGLLSVVSLENYRDVSANYKVNRLIALFV